jgi:Ni,Fe-hydrogenase III large subunit
LGQTFHPQDGRWIAFTPEDMKGDVYTRFALRLAEVETSFYLIDAWIRKLLQSPGTTLAEDAEQRLREAWAFDSGMGLVESWRGPIVTWVMKGPQNTIARCKITGPSILNWFVFPLAVARHAEYPRQTNILPDFPLINQSFNLSYAEHDL